MQETLKSLLQHHNFKIINYTSTKKIFFKSTDNKCWQGCGEKRTLLPFRWECKLVHPVQKIEWKFLKKTRKRNTIYDPAVLLLGIYLEKTIIWKDIYIPVFTEAEFYNSQDKAKCLLTDESIKKMWYIHMYNGILLRLLLLSHFSCVRLCGTP